MTTKEEIIERRTGGLGSSDAKMVARVGRNGNLNDSDTQRIAIMLGFQEQKQFSTNATDFGNEIENHIFDIIVKKYPKSVSNPFYKSVELSEKYGFSVFNHIDFEIITDKKIIWIECKATKASIIDTCENYKEQLSWHQMLLEEKAKSLKKEPVLMICHYHTDEGVSYFLPEKLQIVEVKNILNLLPPNVFFGGLEVISNAIKNFEYVPKEELYSENLPVSVQEKLALMRDYFIQIDEAQKKVDEFKKTMFSIMQENNIKSIKNEFFSITLVQESTSKVFDKKAFETEHPDLAMKYLKEQKRKGFLKITTK